MDSTEETTTTANNATESGTAEVSESVPGPETNGDVKEAGQNGNLNEAEPKETDPLKQNGEAAGSDVNITIKQSAENKEDKTADGEEVVVKKGWDLRCVLIGILVVIILVGGAAIAILANRFKGTTTLSTSSDFRFASHYSSHMVLQRAPLRSVVWGYAPGSSQNATVVLTLESQGDSDEYMATVQRSGLQSTWRIILEPIADKGPYTLTATLDDGESTRSIILEDIVFGDVWVCASETDNWMSRAKINANPKSTTVKIDSPYLRMLSVPSDKSTVPLADSYRTDLSWKIAQTGAESEVPAYCLLFGETLSNRLQYHVGLVSIAQANSLIEDWLPSESLAACNIQLTTRSSGVWNAMVNPLLDLPVYGLIWNHGSKDAVDGSRTYNCTLVELINTWRQRSYHRTEGATDLLFPVGIVQLPPDNNLTQYGYDLTDIRWRQTANYGIVPNEKLARSFLAVTIDLPSTGSSPSSLSRNPWGQLALRLVAGAMDVAYQQKSTYQGPYPSQYRVSRSSQVMKISFRSSDIAVKNTDGFEVCCSDDRSHQCPSSFISVSYAPGREWVPAPITDSTSSSLSLSLSSCNTSRHVVGVRYAWRESPCQWLDCAVYGADLPMAPYIRLSLHDDDLTHNLDVVQMNLI